MTRPSGPQELVSGAPSTPLSKAITFLTAEYKPDAFYWEVVEVFRKLFLTGFLLLLPNHLSFLRVVLALLLSIAYLVLLGVAHPHKQRSTEFLNIALNLSLCFTFVAALLVKVMPLVGSPAERSLFFGWSSAFPLTVIILCFTFGALGIALLVFVHAVREERKQRSLFSMDERFKLLETMRAVGSSAASRPRSERGFKFMPALWGSSKHEDNAKDLITGQPLNAAIGLNFFMGVDDSVADDGVARIVDEVARFVEHLRSLPLDDVKERYAGFARAPAEMTSAELVAKIVEEVQGNLEYILYQPSEEQEYHNGMRDLGRSFGQFCLEQEFGQDEEARARALRGEWPVDFALQKNGKIFNKYRSQWEALTVDEQRRYAVRFEDFLKHPNTVEAWLSPAHVLALRLYTTHAFKYLNGPLRETEHYGQGKRQHPFPLIVSYIAEGIKKMRAVNIINNKDAATTTTILWRGMKGLKVCCV